MSRQQPAIDADSLVRQVSETTIPSDVAELVDEYEDRIGIRDRFLWKWLYFLFPEIQLSCVPAEFDRMVRDAKLLASLYVVILDDVAEVDGDEPTFRAVAKVPFPEQAPDITLSGVDAETVELATRIWECVDAVVRTAPRRDAFRDVLVFDLRQIVDAVRYSYLLNQHLELASLEETVRYDSHNMMLFAYVGFDLLYAPQFRATDLAPLRTVVRRAQQMARYGNWITTWERELGEGDLSSGVIVAALERDIVTREQLRRVRDADRPAERDAVAERIRDAGVEERFFRRWNECYREIEAFDGVLESVDVRSFLDGMETVLDCHVASRGYK